MVLKSINVGVGLLLAVLTSRLVLATDLLAKENNIMFSEVVIQNESKMNMNNLFCKERKRKLSDEDETSRKNPKKKNEDIKPNVDMILKNMKKEPDFMMNTVKKEVDIVVREIKKEPCWSDTEAVTANESKSPIVTRRKGKRRKSGKAGRKPRKTSCRNASVQLKRRTSKRYKKSTQTKKSKNCKRTRRAKSRRKNVTKNRRTGRRTNELTKCRNGRSKKEGSTLLDRQSSANLRLFGFRDELEYFPSESHHNEFDRDSSGSGTIGKRTVLSSLDARKKVLHALKSAPLSPSLKPKPFIQPHEGNDTDLLGSILQSQTLWHSKNSRVKVKEDGSVEVIDRSSKKKLETQLKRDKDLVSAENRKTKEMESEEAKHNRGAQPALHNSLNLNEDLHSQFTEIKIKSEPCGPEDVWSAATVIDEDTEGKIGIPVKREEKEERKNDHLSKAPSPFSAPQKPPPPPPPLLESNSCNSPKNAKSSDDETDDCPIFSIYSAASKTFSRERDKERQRRLTAGGSET